MVGVNQLLSIARSALATSQRGVDVASQNMANASTPGYSRRRTEVASLPSIRTASGQFGGGAYVYDVGRAQDLLVEATYHRQFGAANSTAKYRDLVGQIDALMNEPTGAGLNQALDAYWNSWSDLANNPTSVTSRAVVRERGIQVAGMLNSIAVQVDQLDQSIRGAITANVSVANEAIQNIANLNQEISSAEATGFTAAPQRDQRDQAIETLARLVGGVGFTRPDGRIAVLLNGTPVVDGGKARLIREDPGPPLALRFVDTNDVVPLPGGEMQAQYSMLNGTIPTTMDKLDALARGIVEGVNAIHRTGYIFANNMPPGIPAGDFFDPSGLAARTISIDASIAASPRNIAVSSDMLAAGNINIASQLARGDTAIQIEYPAGTFAGANQFYRALITDVGLESQGAGLRADAADILSAQASQRRESVRGVNIDEELITLMKFQQAYTAAARIVTTADEMAQDLLNMKR